MRGRFVVVALSETLINILQSYTGSGIKGHLAARRLGQITQAGQIHVDLNWTGSEGRPVSVTPREMARRLNIPNRLEMIAWFELAQVFSSAKPDQGSATVQAFAAFEAELADGGANAECFLLQGPNTWVRRTAVRTALETEDAGKGGMD